MARQSIAALQRRAGRLDWGEPVPLDDVRGEVAIAGIGETEYSGASGRRCKDMGLQAVASAVADAGLEPDEIDGLMVSGDIAGQITPDDYRAHFGTRGPLWYSSEGGAMIWGATCAHTAAGALRRGTARNIVNVFAVDWASARAEGSATPGDWHASEPMKAHFEVPFGWHPQPLYFATFARRHMHEYGTTEAQLGHLAAAFRRHANTHPNAVMRTRPLSVDDYLARPYLADPLRVEDCCLISDGAGAFVMTSAQRARDLQQHPVIVEGVGRGRIRHAPYISQQGDITCTPQALSAPWAFAMAEVKPGDLDLIAVYDCFSITALMQIEDMGLCPKGEGGAFVEHDRLHFDRPRRAGGMPCNTHGGLMSHAYVLGIAHVIELVQQLRRSAVNQVEDATLAAYAGFTADEASTLILRRG